MWLDRRSNQPTPSGSPPLAPSRSFSPAPRRSTHLTPGPLSRPGYNSRSSSLSLISRANTSTSSLPGGPRIANGSTLKRQITPPPNIDDPLEILENIIGKSLDVDRRWREAAAEDIALSKPERLLEDISFDGVSLQDFANIEALGDDQESRTVREHTIQFTEEFDKDKAKFEDLHLSILACDSVLQSVETSLTSFQKDLGQVSAEIETLQSRSTVLSTRLENRRVVEKLLGPAVEDVCISPVIVTAISEDPIDENWLRSLAELEKRVKWVNTNTSGVNDIQAVSDVKPLLDNLTNKAIERIRDYLVAQIKGLRSPSMNAQVLQQQKLLKYKDIYGFLMRHHPQLGEEIGQAYINTIRWYYLTNFTRYREALDKLSIYQVDKTDVLGGEQSVQRTAKGPASKPVAHDVYNIGRRMDILRTANATAISSYLAEEDRSAHHIEVPFRNFNIALIDNVSAEYSFLAEFFSGNPLAQMSRRFAEIFEPTFALGQSLVKDLVESTYDCFGLLLCVRLNQRSAFELQRRKVPVADSYINGTNMLLWPRFQLIMDLHCESIKQLGATISGRNAASKLSFAGNATDASKQSTAPHYLTQRFGQFLYGILAISSEASDDEPVSTSLGRLRGEYESFLSKASKGAGTDGKKRDKFLANNYSLVLTIIMDTVGKLAQEQKQHFEELKRDIEARY